MLKVFQEKETARVVNDQFGSPTYAAVLAENIAGLIGSDSDRFGIYHYCDRGAISWFDFARRIMDLALEFGLIPRKIPLHAVSTSAFPTAAVRPPYSVLDSDKAVRELGFQVFDWELNLKKFFREKVASGGYAMTGIWRRGMRSVVFFSVSLFFLDLQGAGVQIACAPLQATARQGEKVILNFTVSNRSAYTLDQAGNFFISYHVRDLSGRLVRFDNRRFSLPLTVKPGSTARFAIPVFFSLDPGNYRLEWDLVREGEFWGRDKSWHTASVELSLLPLVAAEFRDLWLPTRYESGREWLDHEQYLLRQVFRNNEIRFQGKFFGFAAGTTYPQVWIRDTATMLGYARFFYPLPDLQGIVDRFFRTQGPKGEIQDWVDTVGRCDKNTVETDQESSLVLAAWQLALSDSAWLSGKVAGMSRLDRLDLALEWVWKNRLDHGRGLIWSGFTADWGDVERSYPDQRAIKLSDRSRRTFSIYSQSLFIRAAQSLALMAERLGDGGMAGLWRQREKAVVGRVPTAALSPGQGLFPGPSRRRQG